MPRLDGIDASALADQLADQLWYTIGVETAKGQPFAFVLQPPELDKRGPAGGRQPRDADSDRAVLPEDLRHGAGRDHPARGNDREPGADLFGLAQQGGGEKDGGFNRPLLTGDLPGR